MQKGKKDVLDAYSGYFTTEYSKLEAYVDELLRSNPGPTMKVGMCREDIKEGRRVLKIMFVFICM